MGSAATDAAVNNSGATASGEIARAKVEINSRARSASPAANSSNSRVAIIATPNAKDARSNRVRRASRVSRARRGSSASRVSNASRVSSVKRASRGNRVRSSSRTNSRRNVAR